MANRSGLGIQYHFLMGSLMVCLAAGAIGVLHVIEQLRPAAGRAAELSYLPRGEYLRVAVLGYRQLAADLIWLKVVQQFGGKKLAARNLRWAYHAVDVLTDLDPQFAYAYQAAGINFGVWGGMPQESIQILLKGMRNNPEVWELPFFVGYDYYFELHDAARAAQYFRAASTLPGAPAYLPRLAARMTVETGDPAAALEFLQRLYAQAQDEQIREGLAHRIKEVIVERDLRFLEEAVKRYQRQRKQLPKSLRDLVTSGTIRRVPEEPFGGSYELNRDGSVRSTVVKERLRVYRQG